LRYWLTLTHFAGLSSKAVACTPACVLTIETELPESTQRGWSGNVPFIKTAKEKVAATTANRVNLHYGEVFDIWAHLVSRYDALDKTLIFASHAHVCIGKS